jgi:hypothetical protein
MAGIAMGGRYDDGTGNWGTAEEHAARLRAQQTKQPYDASAPSAGAASTAARNVNPNLDFNVSPTGATSLSNQTAQMKALAEFQSRLQANTDATKRSQQLSDRNSLFAQINRPAAPSAATITHGSVNGNEGDARAAAFSRAKDQAGRIARSSLTAIAEQMADRGVTGGGMQALREAGAISGAGAELQDLTRDQMIADVNREADIADMDYQGKITQRGQDLANRQSYMSLLAGLY